MFKHSYKWISVLDFKIGRFTAWNKQQQIAIVLLLCTLMILVMLGVLKETSYIVSNRK